MGSLTRKRYTADYHFITVLDVRQLESGGRAARTLVTDKGDNQHIGSSTLLVEATPVTPHHSRQ